MLVQTVGNFAPVATPSGGGSSPGDLPAVSTGGRAPDATHTAGVNAQSPQTAAPSVEAVREATDHINKALRSLTSNDLQFTVDQDTGHTVVKVVDGATKEVIRQMPSEEALAIAKALDRLQGLLIKHEA